MSSSQGTSAFQITISPTSTVATPETPQPLFGAAQKQVQRTVTETHTILAISEPLYDYLSTRCAETSTSTRTGYWTSTDGFGIHVHNPKNTVSNEYKTTGVEGESHSLYLPRQTFAGKRVRLEAFFFRGRDALIADFPKLKAALTQAAREAREYYAKNPAEDLFADLECCDGTQ